MEANLIELLNSQLTSLLSFLVLKSEFLAAALAEAALEITFQWWWWWGYFQLKALKKCLFH